MDQLERQVYKVRDVEIDVSHRRVRRGSDEIQLREKTAQVLAYLIENRGETLAKDRIIGDVWNGVAVVDDVLVQSIKDIRRALGDDFHDPTFIRTLPRFGYQFIAEVEKVSPESTVDPAPQQTEQRSSFPSRLLIAGGGLALVALIVLVFAGRQLLLPEGPSAVATNGSIAPKRQLIVTFFENQSNSTELEWLREGLADMLIADLSGFTELTLIGRAQLHTLLDKHDSDGTVRLEEALDTARSAGAGTLITGSFARLGDKVRIQAQLYDVAAGELMAVDSITVDHPEQILTEIDALSLKLAGRLLDSEQSSRSGLAEVMTDDLEAYRYYSLAVEKAQGLHNKEAVALLQHAIERDPDFAMAHARIGYTYAVTWGLASEGKPFLEKAFQLSERLTEKDRLNIAAWYAIANLDYPSAIRSFQEIVSKYPSDSEAYWRLGRLLLGEERYDEAIRVLQDGLTHHPDAKDIFNALGATYRDKGEYAEAIAATQRYVALSPNEPNAYDSLALAFQAAGRYEEAEAAYENALRLDPGFDVAVLHLSNLYFQTGRYARALRSYERYIGLADSDWDRAWGWGRIARVHLANGDNAAASRAATQELKLDPNSYANALLTALRRGDRAAIGRHLPRLTADPAYSERGLRPSLRFHYYLAGHAHRYAGRHDEAFESYTQAAKHRPMIWDIDPLEDTLGLTLLETGRFDAAVGEFSRILAANPRYPLARFYLARALESKGLQTEANQAYSQFLQDWAGADSEIPQVVAAKRAIARGTQ